MYFIILLIVAVGAFLLIKSRMANETNVKMADIPAVFDALKASGKNASWAQFCFGIPDKSVTDNAVNLQFSIENDRIGFDWFLLCEINIRDKDKFQRLAERLGHCLTEHKYENGSESLRTENGDLVKLCETVLRDFYQWPPDADIGLIADGFPWPPAAN